VYEIFENLGRIEEICASVSFYFSKIYDLEKNFGNRSKYATISRQTVFLAIQRSNSMMLEIIRKMEIVRQNKIIKTDNIEPLISEIHDRIESIKKSYSQEKYEGIVKQLGEIGDKCNETKIVFQELLK